MLKRRINSNISEFKKVTSKIFNSFKKKDFSGESGQMIKNSSYQLSQNLIFKIGSLIFTAIIARILLPDRMGLYYISMATIIFFSSFGDLGIGSALMVYVSKKIAKKEFSKAKGYIKKLGIWKLRLIGVTSFLLIASSYFISKYYYSKPIFLALLVGGMYLPLVQAIGFLEELFKINNNFKTPMIKEIISQILRLTILPISIIYFISLNLPSELIIAGAIFMLAISHMIALIFLINSAKKKMPLLKRKTKKLNKAESSELRKFIIPLSTTSLAGLFFGYIDTIMLGRFVSVNYIAYYGTAFSLIGAISVIIGFMSISLMPIFARKENDELESFFKKSLKLTAAMSIFAGFLTYIASTLIIRIIYGVKYLPSANILKIFSILLVMLPIISIYRNYYTIKKRTKSISLIVISSSILNIVFNILGIFYGLKIAGEMGAVFGVVFATVLSRFCYLFGLIIFKKR